MIVTTFSPEGYELYGKRFIETYKKHCKEELVVYVEDDLEIEGVEVRNLYRVPGCIAFLNRVRDYKPDHYRRDVNKFSRKVFAITDAMSHKGKVVFIGADTIFHKDIPEGFFDSLLDDVYLAYLGRKTTHSETDFLAFDTTHSISEQFRFMFINTYITGAFQHLKYFCDSDVFDFVREFLCVPENNLNIINDRKHPFVNSILGEYMLHLKGPERKLAGKCFDDDFITRTEDNEKIRGKVQGN